MSSSKVQSDQLHSPWRKFLNDEEKQQVDVYDARIDRQKRILADSVADRSLIMARAIRRMRRAQGKL